MNIAGATNSSLVLGNITQNDAGTYCVLVRGACNSVSNCAVLTVTTPVSAVGPKDQTNCLGSTVTLSTEASGTGPISYQWNKGGMNIAGATNSSLVLGNVTQNDAGTYCVLVRGACNSVSNCAVLTVTTPVSAVGPKDQTNCLGSTVTLSTVASGTGPLSYQWNKGGMNIAGATNSSLVLENVTQNDA